MNNVFKLLNRHAEIRQRRRNLPHWQQPGVTYFVTFRAADSLPQSKLRDLNEQKDAWLQQHPEPWSERERDEYHRRFTEKVQSWLDAGYGACVLRSFALNTLVGSALAYFDGDRYTLDEFVVMPNHVHVILMPAEGRALEGILHSWKSFTANRINRELGRSGLFWMDESYDHAVRSWEQLEHYRRYIRQNPAKAGLREGAFLLGKGKMGIVQDASPA